MPEGFAEIQGNPLTQIRSTGDDGAAFDVAARSYGDLAQGAKMIGDLARGIDAKNKQRQATEDFLEAENEAGPGVLPQVKTKSGIFGIMTKGDAAYNNMMETRYMQRVESDVAAKAIELRQKNFGDVEKFEEDFAEFEAGMLGGGHENFGVETEALIHQQREKVRLLVIDDRRKADIKEARQGMDARIQLYQDDLDAMLRDGGPAVTQTEEFIEKMNRLHDQLQIKTDNPLYEYSPEQAEIDRDAMAVKLETAGLIPAIKDVYESQGQLAALEAADAVAESANLTTAQTATLRNSLRNEVSLLQQRTNIMDSDKREAEKAAEDALKVTGKNLHRNAVDALYKPGASAAEKDEALEAARPHITPSAYSTLLNKRYDTGGSGEVEAGNARYAQWMRSIRKGQMTEEDIYNEAGSMNRSQFNSLLSELDSNRNTGRRRAVDTIGAAFKASMLEGAMAGQALASMEAEAVEMFDNWLSGLDHEPNQFEISQQTNEILKTFNRTGPLVAQSRYIQGSATGSFSGGAEEIQAGIDQLLSDLENNKITEDEAAEQFALIKSIKDMSNVE